MNLYLLKTQILIQFSKLSLLNIWMTNNNFNLLIDIKRLLKNDGRLLPSSPNYVSTFLILGKIVNLIGAFCYADQNISQLSKYLLKELLQKMGSKNKKGLTYINSSFFCFNKLEVLDLIHQHKPKWITRKIGFLLFAQSQK